MPLWSMSNITESPRGAWSVTGPRVFLKCSIYIQHGCTPCSYRLGFRVPLYTSQILLETVWQSEWVYSTRHLARHRVLHAHPSEELPRFSVDASHRILTSSEGCRRCTFPQTPVSVQPFLTQYLTVAIVNWLVTLSVFSCAHWQIVNLNQNKT